jgi:hypothetical protein
MGNIKSFFGKGSQLPCAFVQKWALHISPLGIYMGYKQINQSPGSEDDVLRLL